MPKIRLRKERRSLIPILLCLLFVTSAWAVVVMRGRGFTVAAPGPVDDGTRIVWNFANTNNPTDDDSFVGTNTGTLGTGGAAPTWVDATNGMSASYDFDKGDLVSNVNHVTLNQYTSGTYAAWFKCDDLAAAQNHTIISAADEATDNRLWSIALLNSADALWYWAKNNDTADQLRTPTDSLSQGVWMFMSISSDGSTISMSLNAVTQTLAVLSGANNGRWVGDIDNLDNHIIGSLRRTGFVNYFDGGLDRITEYNTNLTASAISTLFWNTATNHGWSKWDYDNRSDWSNTVYVGTFSYDFPANTAYGATVHPAKGGGGAAPTHEGDTINAWYDCDGGDTITSTATGIMDLATFTIELWVRSEADTGASAWGFTLSEATFQSYISLGYRYKDGDDDIKVFFVIDGGNALTLTTDGTLATDYLNEWHHLALTLDGTNGILYVDGVALKSGACTNGMDDLLTASTPATRWDIGSIAGIQNWNGDLDEVRVHSTALASNRVYAIYNDTKWLFGL